MSAPTPTVDEYFVLRDGPEGLFAIDVVPDVYKDRDYRFMVEVGAADQFATFDEATHAIDNYIPLDPEAPKPPLIVKVRRTTLVEIIG